MCEETEFRLLLMIGEGIFCLKCNLLIDLLYYFTLGSFFGTYAKCAYQGVGNVSFSENFAYVLNE